MIRPPATPLALAGLAALAGAGCGGERPPDEVVKEFVEAFDRADERACGELVTDRYVSEVTQSKLRGDAAREACRKQLEALERQRIEVALVPAVDERGDVARVTVRLDVDGVRRLQRITLRRVDGEWRVDRVQPL